MIHNTWVSAVGNRNDLRAIADTLEPFDTVMADIYSARAGIKVRAAQDMMDAETWIGGSDAVDQGFADGLLPADEVKTDKNAHADPAAAYLVDLALAKAGMPRTQRRALLQEIKDGTPCAADRNTGTPRAAEDGTPGAAVAVDAMAIMQSFQITFKGQSCKNQ
jgi:hypothetical protein